MVYGKRSERPNTAKVDSHPSFFGGILLRVRVRVRRATMVRDRVRAMVRVIDLKLRYCIFCRCRLSSFCRVLFCRALVLSKSSRVGPFRTKNLQHTAPVKPKFLKKSKKSEKGRRKK